MDTEKEITKEEEKWSQEKEILERKYKLKQDKAEFHKSFKKKPSTSKLLVAFLFLNCVIVEIFTGWVTIQSIRLAEINEIMPDFTPLVTLIGAVIGEVIGFAVYALKAAKENSAGGLIYETTMSELKSFEDDTDSVG
jgi:hypothetical protein